MWARAIDADPSHHYAHLALGKMYKVQFTAAKNRAKKTGKGTKTGKNGGTTKGAGAGEGAGAVSRLLVSASRHFAAAARLAPLLAEPLRDHATLLLLVEGAGAGRMRVSIVLDICLIGFSTKGIVIDNK